MEQSPPSEAISYSASQKTPQPLKNPKVHYRVHTSPQMLSTLSQIHLIYNFPPDYPKIHSNIILPFMPRSSEWILSFRFSNQYRNFSVRRHSSVGITLCYGLYDWDSRVRLPAGARNFYLHHRDQNGSGAHSASYPMCTRGSYPGGKTAGA
jgi:hypothetical protein